MYSTQSGLILGFHGCDQSLVDDVLFGKVNLKKSENDYDWLGHGIYFWKNSPERALEYAKTLKKYPKRAKNPIKTPAVIGAVIDLGYCLDLTNYENLSLLKASYESLILISKNSKYKLPENKTAGNSKDLLLRDLDCAVIENLHNSNSEADLQFDSVQGVIWEGKELFPNAGFREKNHIQICIRNTNCIKGFFLPRKLDPNFKKV
jgi:hypothetical protein